MTRRTQYEHKAIFSGDSRGIVRATTQASAAVSKFASQESNAAKAINRYNASVQNSTALTRNLSRVIGGFSLVAVAAEFTRTADAMTLLEGRLNLVTGSTRELEATQAELFSLAQSSRADLEAFTSFYVRLAQRLGTASRNGLELTEVTELVSKSLTIGGATAKETSASLLQLSQALSSGLLRGDEFRSLSENALGLMQAIADGAGVTQAKLREMSIAGEFTTEFFLKALNESAPKIREQFDSLPVTFGQAIQQIRNIATQGVADINEQFNITGNLVTIVKTLADNVDILAIALGGLATIRIAQKIGGLTMSLNKSVVATNLEAQAIRDNSAAKIRNLRWIVQENRERVKSVAGTKAEGLAKVKLARAEQNLTRERRAALIATGRLTAAQKVHTDQLKKATLANTAFSRSIAALGGPVGLIFIAASVASSIALFSYFSDEIELTTKSVDSLNRSIAGLSDQNYESLKATEASIQNEIRWRSEIDKNNEINNQRLEVLRQFLVATQESIRGTEEGNAAYEAELRAKESLLNIEMGLLRADLQRAPTNESKLLVLKDLAVAEEELAEVVSELNRLETEREAAANKARLAFAASNAESVKGIQINKDLENAIKEKAKSEAESRKRLQDLKTIQENLNLVEGASSDFKRVLAKEIETLTKSLDGNTKKGSANKDVVEQLNDRTKKLQEDIARLNEEYERTGSEKFRIQAENLQETLDSINGVTKTAIEKAQEIVEQFVNKEITAKQLEAALKKLSLTQDQYNGIMEETGLAADKAESAVKELLADMERQIKIQRESAASGRDVSDAYDLLEKTAKAAGLSISDLTAKYPDLLDNIKEFLQTKEGIKNYNEGLETIASTLADAVVSGENLADAFKNLWKRMVADFLESGILRLLKSIPQALNGGNLDFGGFNPFGSGSTNAVDIGKTLLNGTKLGNALGLGSGSGTIVGNAINSVFGGTTGSTVVGNGINAIASALGIGSGASTVAAGANFGQIASGLNALFPAAAATTAATTASTVAAGANFGQIATGLNTLFPAAPAAVPAGGATISSMLAAAGPYVAAIAVAFAVRELLGGGARSFSEIVREDYLEDLLGSQNATEAVGLNGAIGFDGGNTAIFGANFGITGSGLNSQLLVDGGENGNGGFFTGAQSSLDAFGELAKQNGFRVDQANGVLRVLSFDKTKDDIIELWQQFNDGLEGAVAFSEIFATATENNLIKPTNLFFENFATGFGQSAFEARDALLFIDREFDKLVDGGVDASEALITAISDFYNISTDNAQEFVDKSGVSMAQWVANFTNASDDALKELLDFNEQGITQFESAVDAYQTSIEGLSGILGTVDLGELNIPDVDPINIPISTSATGSRASGEVRTLGQFNSAVNSSRVVNVPSSNAPTLKGGDTPYLVGLNTREQFGVTQKGTFERIERKLDLVVSNPQSGGDVSEDVRELTKAVKQLIKIKQARA